ncbi:TIGR04282 family arsenosugar biosynthesis glycosyltransferase [Peptostreptococcus faecalis]|uniref:TIGR04282 family arsenosugar biosynthesis glycosyltransferase n=1 Tax=Peptostreptococcus faecalis TaxID=2045015 RepID=UPI0015E1443E|nr:TIGR04282 family arsenosugar biosynthesis glycosyltransferase [Peptostreptococcus faecalis]
MKKGLIVFTRLPIEGQTKTRLETKLSEKQCATLHYNMLLDLADNIKDVNADKYIFHTSNGNVQILKNIFGKNCSYIPQSEGSIWVRMYKSIDNLIEKGYDKVILIGSDIPQMFSEHINKSFEALSTSDLVITPTEDSGYCLIGMSKTTKEIFEIDSLSGDSVYLKTIQRAVDNQKTVYVNKYMIDLDEEEDIFKLLRSKDIKYSKNTIKYLNKIGY